MKKLQSLCNLLRIYTYIFKGIERWKRCTFFKKYNVTHSAYSIIVKSLTLDYFYMLFLATLKILHKEINDGEHAMISQNVKFIDSGEFIVQNIYDN